MWKRLTLRQKHRWPQSQLVEMMGAFCGWRDSVELPWFIFGWFSLNGGGKPWTVCSILPQTALEHKRKMQNWLKSFKIKRLTYLTHGSYRTIAHQLKSKTKLPTSFSSDWHLKPSISVLENIDEQCIWGTSQAKTRFTFKAGSKRLIYVTYLPAPHTPFIELPQPTGSQPGPQVKKSGDVVCLYTWGKCRVVEE